MRLSVSGTLVARVALVHEGDFDRVTSRFLDLFGQCSDLCSILLVGRGNQDRQQLAQGIDSQMGESLPRIQP